MAGRVARGGLLRSMETARVMGLSAGAGEVGGVSGAGVSGAGVVGRGVAGRGVIGTSGWGVGGGGGEGGWSSAANVGVGRGSMVGDRGIVAIGLLVAGEGGGGKDGMEKKELSEGKG